MANYIYFPAFFRTKVANNGVEYHLTYETDTGLILALIIKNPHAQIFFFNNHMDNE